MVVSRELDEDNMFLLSPALIDSKNQEKIRDMIEHDDRDANLVDEL